MRRAVEVMCRRAGRERLGVWIGPLSMRRQHAWGVELIDEIESIEQITVPACVVRLGLDGLAKPGDRLVGTTAALRGDGHISEQRGGPRIQLEAFLATFEGG